MSDKYKEREIWLDVICTCSVAIQIHGLYFQSIYVPVFFLILINWLTKGKVKERKKKKKCSTFRKYKSVHKPVIMPRGNQLPFFLLHLVTGN